MTKKNSALAIVFLAGLAGSNAMAQKDSLSGTWKLNLGKSYMGSDHPSSDYQLTKKIEQENGLLSITDSSVHATIAGIQLPNTVTTVKVAPDGKEYDIKLPSVFPGIPEMTGKASAAWQGCTLEVSQLIPAFGSSTKQRLFLSDDRSELIVLVEGHSGFQDTEQRLVFEKKD
jgi:hypothetical protein